MPSREVVQHFEDIAKEATGEGPIQEITTETPQGLITKHKCLAARPNAQSCPQHYDDGRLQANQNRVQSTGARTPFSIAAEIEAQVAATKARRESEAKAKNET
ncbi:uncharacterized protein NECHADRAFT_86032 [Fusarium vanettenii 77-13-4]|uniref:Uncharacterized protein n=1 Tax=Fusarium vanettenii (strain ATCC MYA-4622 / CBS 123669 / FGSC 9596 / NRRL 45880 / 77-13-4) TaxID=660122 RepID=C7Z256_FUSV7|nr:uncharacterized protein NECHADRAFT_86032 [Fusarium vanettenii 77-13-4]EEU42114.1 hypothetical protein NECHADRAFT_86032 [Fusarium vanettenii 77-13-4]